VAVDRRVVVRIDRRIDAHRFDRAQTVDERAHAERRRYCEEVGEISHGRRVQDPRAQHFLAIANHGADLLRLRTPARAGRLARTTSIASLTLVGAPEYCSPNIEVPQ
jgi:hypothetical protein